MFLELSKDKIMNRHRVQLVGGLLIEPLVRVSNPSGARVQWIGSC
jgi:hypothetical protein